MKNTIVFIISLFSILFLLNSCQKEEIQPQSKFEVSTNPEDPHIMKVTKPDGTTINYYGEKTTDGRTKRIQLVQVNDQHTGETTITQIDDNNRIETIYAGNGERYDFNWLTSSKFRLTATSADGQYQAIIPVDLNNIEQLDSLSVPSDHLLGQHPRGGRRINLTTQSAEAQTTNNVVERNGDRFRLDIQQCGASIDPKEHSLTVLEYQYCKENRCELGGLLMPAQPNTFEYLVPRRESGIPTDLANICNSIESKVGNACTAIGFIFEVPFAVEHICLALQQASMVFAPNPGAVFAACETGFRSVQVGCLLFTGAPGEASPVGDLCNWVESLEGELNPNELKIRPISTKWKADYKTISYDNFPAVVNLEIEGETGIQKFSTSPSDPSPLQDYFANATISCAADKQVTISVLGTDGYTDTRVFYPENYEHLSLFVPGAVGGVRDIITIDVENGPKLTINIVF